MLLPPACPSCGVLGEAPCGACRAALEPAPALAPPPGLAACAALLAYEGVGRELVARLKYRNARCLVPWLSQEMAALAHVHGIAGRADVVSWPPTTTARRRQRGFDQGRLLARALARRLGLPCRSLLRRAAGPAQTGLSRAERLRAPAFEVASGRLPSRVLLVDDVVTTGATLASAARQLRGAGARQVVAVVAARRT